MSYEELIHAVLDLLDENRKKFADSEVKIGDIIENAEKHDYLIVTGQTDKIHCIDENGVGHSLDDSDLENWDKMFEMRNKSLKELIDFISTRNCNEQKD